MSWRTTVILLILAAGLLYFAYFVDAPPPEVDSHASLFSAAAESSVKTLTIQRGAETLRLERQPQEDGWLITEPIRAPAELSEIDAFLRNFLALRAEKEVVESTDEPLFGLDAPRATITVEGDDLSHTLRVGRETPWPGGFYARTDRSAIVAIADNLVTKATAPLVNFRRRQVVAVPFDAVTGFSIETTQGKISCQKEGDLWWIQEPQRGLAGADEVAGYINALKRLRADAFADDAPTPQALRTYGLSTESGSKDAPPITVSLFRKDKEPLTLWFGRAASDLKYGTPPRYLRLSDFPFVYTAVAKNEEVTLGLPDLRADKILALEGKTVTEIEIRQEGEKNPLFLRKEGEHWVFPRAEEAGYPTRRADDIEVHKWLAQFTELKFRQFAKDESAQDKRFEPFVVMTDAARRKGGLQPPWATITFSYKNGKETLHLAEPQKDRCLVLRDGEGLAVWVPAKIGDAASVSYPTLRDKTMTDLWSDGAYLLHARYRGGKEFTFRKQENGQWLADGPDPNEETKTDRPEARDLARKLARLPAARILPGAAPSGRKTNGPDTGLSSPEAAIQAYYAGARPEEPDASCTLLVGNRLEDGSRYARLEEDRFGHLFTIPADLADKILNDLPKAKLPETKK